MGKSYLYNNNTITMYNTSHTYTKHKVRYFPTAYLYNIHVLKCTKNMKEKLIKKHINTDKGTLLKMQNLCQVNKY